jgi:hypothetical protein
MSSPYFIVDGDDVCMFGSIAKAERVLEAVDVRDGAYVGYDAEGRQLQFKTLPRRHVLAFRSRQPEVCIALAEEQPSHNEELRTLLARHLAMLKDKTSDKYSSFVPGSLANSPLQDLVDMMIKIYK